MRPCSAWVHGDIFTKLSFLIWGLGYIGHGQLIKALLVTVVQGLGLYFLGTSGVPALKKFGTLGTVQMEMKFNPLTLKNEVNDYDNSFAILLLSVIAMVVIVSLIAAAMMVVISNFELQQQRAAGKKTNSFRQDVVVYLNEKFYVTLLTLPVLGVVVFTIVPLFILIAVAFTNYDQQHMPPVLPGGLHAGQLHQHPVPFGLGGAVPALVHEYLRRGVLQLRDLHLLRADGGLCAELLPLQGPQAFAEPFRHRQPVPGRSGHDRSLLRVEVPEPDQLLCRSDHGLRGFVRSGLSDLQGLLRYHSRFPA